MCLCARAEVCVIASGGVGWPSHLHRGDFEVPNRLLAYLLFTPSGRNRTHAEVARMEEQVGFSTEAEEGESVAAEEEKGNQRGDTVGAGGGNKEDPIGREEASEAEHEREVPRRSGTRAEAGEVPEWLKSAVRNSTGGGSDQGRSHDVRETSAVNKDRGDERERRLDTVGETERLSATLLTSYPSSSLTSFKIKVLSGFRQLKHLI